MILFKLHVHQYRDSVLNITQTVLKIQFCEFCLLFQDVTAKSGVIFHVNAMCMQQWNGPKMH